MDQTVSNLQYLAVSKCLTLLVPVELSIGRTRVPYSGRKLFFIFLGFYLS